MYLGFAKVETKLIQEGILELTIRSRTGKGRPTVISVDAGGLRRLIADLQAVQPQVGDRQQGERRLRSEVEQVFRDMGKLARGGKRRGGAPA